MGARAYLNWSGFSRLHARECAHECMCSMSVFHHHSRRAFLAFSRGICFLFQHPLEISSLSSAPLIQSLSGDGQTGRHTDRQTRHEIELLVFTGCLIFLSLSVSVAKSRCICVRRIRVWTDLPRFFWRQGWSMMRRG